ncbi:MAG: hypothetical protein LBD06_06605 [Candidatus Accumulibacter sp.]|nr:hypothetical protein [Accumulibacter sp.]
MIRGQGSEDRDQRTELREDRDQRTELREDRRQRNPSLGFSSSTRREAPKLICLLSSLSSVF